MRIVLLSSLFLTLFSFLINASPLQRVSAQCKKVLIYSTIQGYVQESSYGVRNKKPFCNAFTGCGRKRSDPDVANDELLGLLADRIQGIRNQVIYHEYQTIKITIFKSLIEFLKPNYF